ncbi:MAG: membrane protease subunit HflC, partial [Candidatus Azotimanducaceae bacterium]
SNPKTYFEKLGSERRAMSRLDDIIGSEVRTAIAGHELIEVVRSDKDRELPPNPTAEGTTASVQQKATRGRMALQKDILAAAAPKLVDLGIELLDIRIKRVNYNQDVARNIYQRMISERQQIAQRFRSEGEGEAARINGRRGRDLLKVESEAYKRVQELQGEADAEASRIYAEAYNQSKEAQDFYGFIKTLDTYRMILGKQTSMILSTDSELFELLERSKK